MRYDDHATNLPLSGLVDAAGNLTISFGPPANQAWDVQQVTLNMPTAPSGAIANLFYQNSLHAPAPSARRSAAAGVPGMFLHGGELGSLRWEGCTPNDTGSILVIYVRGDYVE